MRSYKIFVLSFLALLFTFTETKATPMNNPQINNPLINNPWFSNTDCSSIEIKKLKSIADRKVISSVKIEDTQAIKSLMQRIAKIPADGGMMKSFSDQAEEINLVFHCANQAQQISIFEKRFQTPSTGFNEGKNQAEESLYNDIDALLFPDFNKRILKIEMLPLHFKGFTVIYKGSTFKDLHPESVQITTQKFLIKYKKHEQKVEVKSGQIAPQPKLVDLQLNRIIPLSSTVKLHTYQSSQGEELYPDYFQITK